MMDGIIQRTPLIQHSIGVSYAEGRIPPDLPKNVSIEFRQDRLTNGLVATMRAYLAKGTHQERKTTHLRIPATWWEHFKETNFPKWLLKFFPVQYTERPFTYESQTRICPHGDMSWGDRSHIDFLRYEDASMIGSVTLSPEWWTKFNNAMLDFDSSFWGEDLTVRVFNVIDRAKTAEKKVGQLQIELEASRRATKMWYDAAHEKRDS